MSTYRYGLGSNEIIAGLDFRVVRDAEGKTSASRSFTIRKEDKDSGTIQSSFARGVPITTISPDLGAYWNFLEIESHEMEDEAGGFCRVYATFTGYTESGDYDFDRETTKSLRGVLTERPMIEHPNYIAEVKDAGSTSEHAAIVGLYHGTAYVTDPTASEPQVRNSANDQVIITALTDTDALKWYNKIFTDGKRTYLGPQYEWTVEQSNAGGLSSGDLATYGKKDSPPGSPPEPAGVTGWWHFVDVADSRSSNSSSHSRTWRFNEGTVDADVYDY